MRSATIFPLLELLQPALELEAILVDLLQVVGRQGVDGGYGLPQGQAEGIDEAYLPTVEVLQP